MTKILHLITDLSTGGAEVMLFRLLSHVDRSSFYNIVVSMTDDGTLGKHIKTLGIPVYTLNMKKGVPNPMGLLHLVRLLLKERPQILQTWLYHADLLGLLAGKLTRISNIIWNLRCSYMDMRHYSRLSGLVVKTLAKLSKFPDVVVVNSETGKKFHENIGYNPNRWEIVPNGFDLNIYKPNPESRIKFREDLGLSENTILIGLIARFDPMKDHKNFIKSALVLLKKFDNIHFILVGRGINENNTLLMKDIIGSKKEKHFHLLGERADIPYIMSALDISSSSSFGEGFPNNIGEAMACSIPCVVTDVGASALIVGGTGMVVPPRNSQALAKAWSELIDLERGVREQLGMAARKRIMENFNLPDITARYEKLYKELAV